MNPYQQPNTTTTYRVVTQNQYRPKPVPNRTTQYVYNQNSQYRGNSQSYRNSNRRVRSVNINNTKPPTTFTHVPQTKNQPIGLDQMNQNLQKYTYQKPTSITYSNSNQRSVSIRSANKQNLSNPTRNYTPSKNMTKDYQPRGKPNIQSSNKSTEKFISNPTTNQSRGNQRVNPLIGLTISERNNNTEIYTSKIKTSTLFEEGLKGHQNVNSISKDVKGSLYGERDVAYQSIIPGSNTQQSHKNSFVHDSSTRGRYNSRSSRERSSGRIKGNTFINIPKVQTNYGIMKQNKKRTYQRNNKNFYDSNQYHQSNNMSGYADPYFNAKIKESNEMLSGYNSAEKRSKKIELNEYEMAKNQIDSNKLFKNNYQIDKKNKLQLEDNIFAKEQNYMESVRSRSRNRNPSRSRSRLAKMDLIGRSQEKTYQKPNNTKLDPFSYKFNVSPKPLKKEEPKTGQSGWGVNKMANNVAKYSDTAITFDPIIEKKVRALPKEKVEKALFNSNNINSIDELKDKIMRKNEMLVRLKEQHMKLLQDPKNPDNLRSQLEMREKQNKKILEKIRNIRKQTEQKKEEYKELIEIDNQMKSLLGMMTESEKKERDRLIAELKRTDELYLKTKQENEQLKNQMEDSSKGMVFKQHLIDEEVNRVKSMIEEQLEDDFEKGNQMLIDQIKKMYNKLLAAKN